MLKKFEPPVGAPDLASLFAPVSGSQVLGLAVSGGVDSLALMILAARWAAPLSAAPRLIVYTLDHELRAEAKAETAFVQAAAEELGLEVRVLHWGGDKPKSGLQAAARAARYQIIGAAMAQDGAEILLTAHHLQDQAETVLMRMAHGSGLNGLGGIRAFSNVENVHLFRPLLGVQRNVLEAVVQSTGLTPVQDPSNMDMNFERVRWRNMQTQLGALGLDGDAIGLFAKRAQRADSALQTMCHDLFDQLAKIDNLGVLRLEHEKLMSQPQEVQLRLVQLALRCVGGGNKPFALQQIERLGAELTHVQGFRSVTLLGCYITLNKGQIVISREAARVPSGSLEIAPGQSLTWDNRFELLNNSNHLVTVCAGALLRKQQAAVFLERQNFAAQHVHAAPLVVDQSETILALGAHNEGRDVLVRFVGRECVG